LSDHYVGLGFEAHQHGLISTARLAEMLKKRFDLPAATIRISHTAGAP
jgi:hypothetical protein